MPNEKTSTIKIRSLEFLEYLEDRGLKISCPKEDLRDIYNGQFKPICRAENLDTRGASFSAVLYMWMRVHAITRGGSRSHVNFNPRYKNKNAARNAQNGQVQRSSTTPQRSSTTPERRSATPQASTSRFATNGPSAAVLFTAQLTKDDNIPLWIKINPNQVICKVCGTILTDRKELAQHSNTRNHRIQGLILALKENKPFLVQNKEGIEISSPYDGDQRDGSVHFEILEKQRSSFQFEIRNNSENIIIFKKCEVLKKVGVFTLSDVKNVTSGVLVKISPGSVYKVNLSSFADNVGRYRTSLSFTFATMDQQEKNIHIIRLLACRCNNAIVDEFQPTAPYTPVRKTYYTPRVDIVEGLAPELESSSKLERSIPLEQHKVPNAFRDVIKHKLDGSGLSGQSADFLDEIKPYLTHSLSWHTYMKRFSTLLHAEEIQMELDIRNYDMNNATMEEDRNNRRLLTLKVPGLAENRPSVLRGDVLYAAKKLTADTTESKEYKGYVHEVYQNEVGIGFSKQLRDEFVKNMKFSVRFTFNRLALRLMHRSVKLADENSLENMLFPNPDTVCQAGTILADCSSLRPVNRLLENNTEQMQAIKNILMGTSRPAPYLIFGPPGTGKTVTLVEAIQQVVINISGVHILACAPSNSAADLIAQRLVKAGRISKSEIYRMCAVSRSYDSVPEDIKEICNYNKSSKQFWFPSKAKLQEYKVIVTTLVTAGRIASANFPSGHFSHVFIDEAGHATEPEAVIALAGIIETDVPTPNGGQVVLAGDPEQLGPILRSSVSTKYGLGISVLERLMKTCEVYSRRDNGREEVYDLRLVTKLLQNYRSHPSILQLPNELFYDEELRACADRMSRECLCSWNELPKKGFPLIFHGIAGQDMREEKSPSFFNPEEIAKVMEYVEKLFENKAPRLKQSDIGIISPYRKQVQKLQQALRKRNWKEIKVGSVEEFQGRENTVIIISTVRSNPEYLAVDAEFKLGFLANPKRFNVAVTRAKALLIIVGNPATLSRDKYWKRILDFCKTNSAYTGCYYSDMEEEFEDIRQKLADMKLEDVVSDNAAQGEDLPWRNDP